MGLIPTRGLSCTFGLISFLTLIGVFHHGTEALTFQGGTSKSYARFPKWNACVNASISFEFKTLESDGLLMYTDDKGKYDFFEVYYTFLLIFLYYINNNFFVVFHSVYRLVNQRIIHYQTCFLNITLLIVNEWSATVLH